MKEDLTFFKGDNEKPNKDGSRVKNSKRVFAAKKAHRTHGLSYTTANNRGKDMKKDRASLVTEALKKYIEEAEIEQNNPVNLFATINMENTTGGIQIQFDENNYSSVDITMIAQDKDGVGAYQLESQTKEKTEAVTTFSQLVQDLKILIDNFDKDFEAVLKKNGIVRRVG